MGRGRRLCQFGLGNLVMSALSGSVSVISLGLLPELASHLGYRDVDVDSAQVRLRRLRCLGSGATGCRCECTSAVIESGLGVHVVSIRGHDSRPSRQSKAAKEKQGCQCDVKRWCTVNGRDGWRMASARIARMGAW